MTNSVFHKIAPAFNGEIGGESIGELCLVELDQNNKKYVAVASLHSSAFGELSNFNAIKNRLKDFGAENITILLTVECEENDINGGLCVDESREITIYFNIKE
jgi:hypothetical protein